MPAHALSLEPRAQLAIRRRLVTQLPLVTLALEATLALGAAMQELEPMEAAGRKTLREERPVPESGQKDQAFRVPQKAYQKRLQPLGKATAGPTGSWVASVV